jgi:diguanylate cyclase (GGDEF)-like protein
MAGRDPDPDLERALEMARRARAALSAGDPSTAERLLQEAEQSLQALQAQVQAAVTWSPAMTHGALGEALIEIVQVLQRADEAIAAEEPYEEPASTDALTELPSYAAFQLHLAELEASVPVTETCWLLMADIDDFKAVNERHGHAAGDAYLKAVAETTQDLLPSPHFLARVGGDELAAALRGLTMDQARAVAEHIRAAVEKLDQPARASLSIGVAGWLPASEPVHDAVRRSDLALYVAKRAGGNRVHVSGSDG